VKQQRAHAPAKNLKSQIAATKTPRIFAVRGLQVVVDFELAETFEVLTKVLNQTVKRNQERFPEDFCFQLTTKEWQNLRSQFVTSSLQPIDSKGNLISQSVISSSKSDNYGGRRTAPYVFTEHGVTMVAGLLRAPRAVGLSIHIVREFVRLRRAAVTYAELSRRMNQIEEKLGDDVKEIWEVLHHMLMQPAPKPKAIGFIHGDTKK